jgi:Ion channel/Pentapeptide repeats (9 copies)
MLHNFFALNAPFQVLKTPGDLQAQLPISDHLTNLLYEPADLTFVRPYNRITGKTFTNVSFAKTTIRRMEFRGCRFEDCLFIGTVFEDCEFHECSFASCNTHKIVFRNTYVDPEIFAGMLQPSQHANIGVHLFWQLFANASQTYQYAFAHAAEFHFKKWKRYELNFKRKGKKITRLQWLRQWLPDVLYQKFAGYGLRVRYVACWTPVILAIPVAFNWYVWCKLGIEGAKGPVSPNAVDAFYFTIVTIGTLGYGDLVPTSTFGKIAISLEAVLGIVWLSVLASTVIKKVVR